jgi:hypothetical protein
LGNSGMTVWRARVVGLCFIGPRTETSVYVRAVTLAGCARECVGGVPQAAHLQIGDLMCRCCTAAGIGA